MRHDLLVYDSDDGFARYVALFVEEGVEAGHPVVVVDGSATGGRCSADARRPGRRGRDLPSTATAVYASGGRARPAYEPRCAGC